MLASRLFYRFSGVHSLLIGLMPFFIPIILWQQGYRLAEISLFIAITGVGFIGSLVGWQALVRWGQGGSINEQKRIGQLIIILSLTAELALIGVLSFTQGWGLLIGAALLNGLYNCFYWTTQRVMFSQMTKQLADNRTGNHFGNFQIMVVILLKLGVLSGAYLMQHQQFGLLFGLSLLLSLLAMVMWFSHCSNIIEKVNVQGPLRLDWRNKLVFIVDGIFLFFESYFWVLTLFIITDQHIMQLGLTVVGLTVLLSAIFVLIKRRIDSYPPREVFIVAIGLYIVSWGLRGVIMEQSLELKSSEVLLYILIIVVAFCTSFFRLSFNKLFFEQVSQQVSAQQFIAAKSYLSQAGMVVFFGALALVLHWGGEDEHTLSTLYWLMIPVASIYGLYQLPTTYPLTQYCAARQSKPIGENL